MVRESCGISGSVLNKASSELSNKNICCETFQKVVSIEDLVIHGPTNITCIKQKWGPAQHISTSEPPPFLKSGYQPHASQVTRVVVVSAHDSNEITGRTCGDFQHPGFPRIQRKKENCRWVMNFTCSPGINAFESLGGPLIWSDHKIWSNKKQQKQNENMMSWQKSYLSS